jgi:hypothetical protein
MMVDKIDPRVPQAVINAVVAKVILDERFKGYWAAEFGDGYRYCDMTPVVHVATVFEPVNEWGDSWYVEVQYSSKGARAGYGVNAQHVPTCYVN